MPSRFGPQALPGGAPLGGIIGGFLGDLFGGDAGGVPSPALASGGRIYNFSQNMLTGRVSATPRAFNAMNPVTGDVQMWRPAGRVLLTSGDLSACKRVNKVASRAKRSKGR